MTKWAIASMIKGKPHLYYSTLQFPPAGSISLSELESKSGFYKAMLFDTELEAYDVFYLVIAQKAMTALIDWDIVPVEVEDKKDTTQTDGIPPIPVIL